MSRQQGCTLITGGVTLKEDPLEVKAKPRQGKRKTRRSLGTSPTFHRHRLVLLARDGEEKRSERPAAGGPSPSVPSGLLRPVSYGNRCGRMRSIAKQVTLAPTATHKTVKNPGVFGSGPGVTAEEKTEQRGRIKPRFRFEERST